MDENWSKEKLNEKSNKSEYGINVNKHSKYA